jgi:hypothetical protein
MFSWDSGCAGLMPRCLRFHPWVSSIRKKLVSLPWKNSATLLPLFCIARNWDLFYQHFSDHFHFSPRFSITVGLAGRWRLS